MEANRKLRSEFIALRSTDCLPGIFIDCDEDISHFDVLITGPSETPYSGGLFHFDLKFPQTYPFEPPVAAIKTTDGGRVRFSPNLYKNGKVCLSILGTFSGPAWTASQNLSSVLLSIQSLMSARPYHNEPGFEHEMKKGDAEKYNDRIWHETLRVAVCGQLEEPSFSSHSYLREVMKQQFLANYDDYMKVAEERKEKFDGKRFEDPFRDMIGSFDYQSIIERLRRLKESLTHEAEQPNHHAKGKEKVEVEEEETSSTNGYKRQELEEEGETDTLQLDLGD